MFLFSRSFSSSAPLRARASRAWSCAAWLVLALLPACARCSGGEELRELPEGVDRAVRDDARACDQGDPYACNNVGAAWEAGIGGQVDLERAVLLYERACNGGASLACVNQANLLDRSQRAVDRMLAMELLDTACAENDLIACQELAARLADPEHPRHDPHRAVSVWSANCERHVMAACVAWAEAVLEAAPGTAEAEARAQELTTRACDAGHPDGCASLGWLLATARTLPTDPVRGFAMLERACFAGDARACRRALDVELPADAESGASRRETLRAFACEQAFADGCDPEEGSAGRADAR